MCFGVALKMLVEKNASSTNCYSSCCEHELARELEEEGPEPISCLCFLDKEEISPEANPIWVKPPQEEKLRALGVFDRELVRIHLSSAVSHVSKWPPDRFVVIQHRERLSLQGCYLL